jgi:hypothetical protein
VCSIYIAKTNAILDKNLMALCFTWSENAARRYAAAFLVTIPFAKEPAREFHV